MGKIRDLTGQRFGRLTVIERFGSCGHGDVNWLCICDCGNEHIASRGSLLKGKVLSCGCLRREQASHIHTYIKPKHGGSGTRLYRVWRNMKSRCNCPTASKYNLYGGRGIKVCDEWLSFDGFQNWSLSNGYRDDLTIDRIDGGKNYYPENCRWVTPKVQGNNTSQNHKITYGERTQTLAQWADELGIPYKTVSERIRRKWDVKKAFETPVKNHACKTS